MRFYNMDLLIITNLTATSFNFKYNTVKGKANTEQNEEYHRNFLNMWLNKKLVNHAFAKATESGSISEHSKIVIIYLNYVRKSQTF